jgi:ribosomal protein S18 acetylase RimI-like enzyme
MDGLKIRLAQPEDRADVLAISATVWDGNDYIPNVWDTWLQSPIDEGFVLVGESAGHVVGLQHTRLQPGGVAWMEGIRVHPEWRNQGIAKRLLDDSLRRSRDLGANRARLSTANVNKVSQTVAQSIGFHFVDEFTRYNADALDKAPTGIGGIVERPITTEELSLIRKRTGDGVALVADSWTAFDLPDQYPPESFALSALIGDPIESVALAGAMPERDRLTIVYLAGSQNGIRDLSLYMRAKAFQRSLPKTAAWVRNQPSVTAGLTAAGFEPQSDISMCVFERPLS